MMTRKFVTIGVLSVCAALGGGVALTAANSVSTEPAPAFVSNIGAQSDDGSGATVNTIGRPAEPGDDNGGRSDNRSDDSPSATTAVTSAPRRSATTTPGPSGTTVTSIDDHGGHGRGTDDSTDVTTGTAPKTTSVTVDDHGGDSGNRGRSGGSGGSTDD